MAPSDDPRPDPTPSDLEAVALLALDDFPGSNCAAATAHQDAHAVVAAARDLMGELPPSPHPLIALAHFHRAIEAHILFAPPERGPAPMALKPIRLTPSLGARDALGQTLAEDRSRGARPPHRPAIGSW